LHLVPPAVLELKKYGLEIKGCEDHKSFNKFLPSSQEDPSAFIATADDDQYYSPDWLEKLVDNWDGDYNTVVLWRAHLIKLDAKGLPVPYKDWGWEHRSLKTPSKLLFPTTGFGALFPPGGYHQNLYDTDKLDIYSTGQDDIWLYWMSRMGGKKFKAIPDPLRTLNWPSSQGEALWHENVTQGQNDVKIKRMIEHYGFPSAQD
jgi:hypothetical protein